MSLPTPAAQASKAALSAAIAENGNGSGAPTGEEGEAQELEVNMENQAEHIRTVFNDPTNFNVKVRTPTFVCCRLPVRSANCAAPALLTVDPVVRLTDDEGPQPPANAWALGLPADPWRRAWHTWANSSHGMDGGYQACDQRR
jgi:hypothetical protein